jgi:hypothetical protein
MQNYMNPSNKYTETVSSLAWLWVLFFGPVYLALKGVWRHVFISIVLTPFGLPWLVYPFYAKSILHNNYLRMGWIPIDSEGKSLLPE